MSHKNISAEAAMEKLIAGNQIYLNANYNPGNESPALRHETCEHGQHPYAVVLCCSDSREVPEDIFSAGIGELFVIRVAGNVIGDHAYGSVEYAVDHLGCNLVLVMGHDHCGAVDAAMHDHPEGHVKTITDEIRIAIGDETDYYQACCLNARRSVQLLQEDEVLKNKVGLKIVGGIYHLDDGTVDFFG